MNAYGNHPEGPSLAAYVRCQCASFFEVVVSYSVQKQDVHAHQDEPNVPVFSASYFL